MVSELRLTAAMRLFNWSTDGGTRLRPRAFAAGRLKEPAIGDYVGRGRYMPRDMSQLSPQLCRAIGKVIHLQLAGVARVDQPYSGQLLYRECAGTSVLAGFWIPEQDLEFVD